MAILDKLKEMAKKQFNEKNIDYNTTTDKELLNLRRQRRLQDERIEKEKLKDEVKKHNEMETRAFNQGKKLGEMELEVKKKELEVKKKETELRLFEARKKQSEENRKKKIKQAMYARTKKQISEIKSKAKKNIKTEFSMKQDTSAKRYPTTTLLGSEQTMFKQPQNQDLGFFRKS